MISRKYLILLATVGTLVSFDQLTKLLVTDSFAPGETLPVVPDFLNLSLVHNHGVAFGIMAAASPAWREPLLFLVPLIVLALILLAFVRLAERQLLSVYALALVVGGALGNLVDRLRLGFVVDFLDFTFGGRHFPAFNLADAAICVGVALLFVAAFRETDRERA